MNKKLALLLAAGALVAGALQAQANTITPTLTGVVGPVWSYRADHTSGELHAGDGFTIFDFGGYVAGSEFAPLLWTATVSNTGSPFGPGLGSDSSDVNLHFTYTGPTIENVVTASLFGPFGASSTSVGISVDSWSSSDHGIGTVGVIGDGSGPLSVAGTIAVPSHVPDGGATAMLLGVGVLGLAGLRRKLS